MLFIAGLAVGVLITLLFIGSTTPLLKQVTALVSKCKTLDEVILALENARANLWQVAEHQPLGHALTPVINHLREDLGGAQQELAKLNLDVEGKKLT